MSIERQVRIIAGILVLIGVILTFTVSILFLFMLALVGVLLILSGLADFCALGLLLSKMQCKR